MKIGVNLVQYTDRQGLEVFIYHLLHELKKNNQDELTFFVNEKSKDLFRIDGVQIITVSVKNTSKLQLIVDQQTKLPRLLHQNHIDILLCPSMAMPLWYKNKVVILHDCAWKRFKEEANIFSRVYLWLAVLSIRYRSSGSVAISDFSKSEFKELCHIRAHAVIHEGVPSLPTVSDLNYEIAQKKFDFLLSRESYFFFVGNFHYRKNIQRVLQAFKDFLQKYPHFMFVIAGKTGGYEYGTLVKEVRKLQIEDKIRFVGFISDIEKTILYKNSIALVFPSLYEGFGLPVLEAQSLGVPVLTSRTSSLPEVAGDGAVFINPADVDEIHRGMGLIVSDPVLRDNLIKKGYTNLQRFSWEKSARVLDNFLHSLDFS